MKIVLEKENSEAFKLVLKNSSQATVTTDAAKEVGGGEEGFRPMELMLGAIGSCSSIDVILILKKYQKPYRNYRVTIEATRVSTVPKIFDTIYLSYYVESTISLEKFERAVTLALDKYCSVSKMIIPKVKLEYRCEVGKLT